MCPVGQIENEKKMENLEIKEQGIHMHRLTKQPHYFLGYLFSSGLKPQTSKTHQLVDDLSIEMEGAPL